MRILASSLFALLLVTACDSDSKPKQNPDDAAAKKKADDDEAAKKIAERGKKREADAAAKLKAEEDRKQALVTLCVVPEGKKPKNLDKACEDLATAQMDYFARQYADQPETLEKMKLSAPLQKANMLKLCTSIDIAVGLKNAFDKAPVGFVDSTNDLIATCIQKLGDGAGAESAMPGKKPK